MIFIKQMSKEKKKKEENHIIHRLKDIVNTGTIKNTGRERVCEQNWIAESVQRVRRSIL